jgi:hypothetical protein
MEREIIKRSISMIENHQHNITEEVGLQSSITEEDLKSYLKDVLAEVKHKQV